MSRKTDKLCLAVIGGGAAGLAASVRAAGKVQVTVYEKGERVGKKLLMTGNGRCNIFNRRMDINKFYSEDISVVQEVLQKISVSKIEEFFLGLGLLLRNDSEGRVYPLCNQASAVLDVLRYAAKDAGVIFNCGFNVIKISKKNSGFELISSDGRKEYADKVLIAAGGNAAPKTGSDGSGYKLAKMLGHTVTKTEPALTALKINSPIPSALRGIRCKANVILEKDGGIIAEQSGEIQFTEYGLSGIAVMQLSRYDIEKAAVRIDFAENFSMDDILKYLYRAAHTTREIQDITLGIVPRRVGQQIVKNAVGKSLSSPVSRLTDKEIIQIAKTIKGLKLPISGKLSWDNAQVTRGGVKLSEINPNTMESRICKGVYFAGEVLDCDGECGGYNLAWAWGSAIIAADGVCGF